jgi:hypothetical protein
MKHWWPIAKALIALAIVVGVGWRFAGILRRPELWERPLNPRYDWLTAGGFIYILGLGFSALFWYRLLAAVGERPWLLATVRAYYIGHSGKYVPGKAWGLLLRTGLLASSGVRPGIAAMTATYETLTTMASGALVAAVLLALVSLDTTASWWSFGLFALAGLPLLPMFFNPLMKLIAGLAGRAARRFDRNAVAVVLPPVRLLTLLGGLAITACGWALLGLSLLTVLQAMLPVPTPWSAELWARCTAYAALAWVGGFMFIPSPGGMGVREAILEQMLTPEIRRLAPGEDASFWAVIVVLVLRLLWTLAEIIMVLLVAWLPIRNQESGVRNQESEFIASTTTTPPDS